MPQRQARPLNQSPRPKPATKCNAAPAPDEWTDKCVSAQAARAAKARKQSGRRRGVDPTTTERIYDADELEFILAMDKYKRESRRPFPTWSEILEVLISLGYRKQKD